MGKLTALIPAAGQGKRMKSKLSKQFILLQGMPIIAHTLKVFQAALEIDDIVLICPPGEEESYQKEIICNYEITKPTVIVSGGQERQESVYYGLLKVTGESTHVIIHDGARPLVTADLISRVAEEVKIKDAVVVGVPVKDTIKRTDAGGYIIDTLQRERLWHIQTPQAFALNLIKQAHEQAKAVGFYGTDDAALVERIGFPVKIIPGSYENIKITSPEDILVAEMILCRREKH